MFGLRMLEVSSLFPCWVFNFQKIPISAPKETKSPKMKLSVSWRGPTPRRADGSVSSARACPCLQRHKITWPTTGVALQLAPMVTLTKSWVLTCLMRTGGFLCCGELFVALWRWNFGWKIGLGSAVRRTSDYNPIASRGLAFLPISQRLRESADWALRHWSIHTHRRCLWKNWLSVSE